MRRRCAQPRLSEKDLLTDVETMLSRVTISEEECAMVTRVLADAEERGQDQLTQQKARAEAEITTLNGQQSRLLDLLVQGAITQDDYDFKRRELAGRRAEATLTIANADGAMAEGFQKARQFVDALVDANKAFETMPVPARREFLRALGFQIAADGPKAHLQLSEPTSLVAERGQSREWWSLWTDVTKFFLGDVNIGETLFRRPEAT